MNNLSKARKQGIYEKELIYYLVASVYGAYGDYYIGEGDVRKSVRYFNKALDYLDEIDTEYLLSGIIKEKLAKLK